MAGCDNLRTGTGRSLGFALVATLATAAPFHAPAAAQDVPTRAPTRDYDIPAQNLEVALHRLGQQSGIDLLYERGVLAGLRSAPVRGVLTPQAAVAQMLAGTPLTHRFTSPTAVLILPARAAGQADSPAAATGAAAGGAASRIVLDRLEVRAERVIGNPPRPSYHAFGQLVRAAVGRRLKEHPGTRGRAFRVRLAMRFDTQGSIREVQISRAAGRDIERAIVAALVGTTLPDPPPPAMPQPIWLEIDAR